MPTPTLLSRHAGQCARQLSPLAHACGAGARARLHGSAIAGAHPFGRAHAQARAQAWRSPNVGGAVGTAAARRGFHGGSAALQQKRDFYEVLGVERNVDAKELKKKYRDLAKKYHPDSSSAPDATSKFQEITHAYETLSDPQKREQYDMFGPDYESGGGGGGPAGGAEGFGGFQGFEGFEDFFRQAGFQGGGGGGGGGQQRRSMRVQGENVQVRVTLSFEEAVRGCTKPITYAADKPCGTCEGSGAKKGEKAKHNKCRACNGQGVRVQMVGGFIQVPTPCEVCSGTGRVISNKCGTCRGTGVEHDSHRTESLTFPPGVDTGMSLGQARAGSAGRLGGPPGDLVVEIVVKGDPYFQRRGRDVLTVLPLSLTQAVLGDKVSVRTLDGEVDMTVNAGASNGEMRRLRGKGIADVNRRDVRGDHLVTLTVNMPQELTARQVELMREFEEEEKLKGKKTSKA